MGNRVSQSINGVQSTYTVDDNDRLVQQGSTSYTYDDNGNTLTENDGITVTTSVYDSRNRLVGSDAGGAVIEMAYDADGLRIRKGGDGETTEYLVDTNRDYGQVLFERTGSSALGYTFGTDLLGLTSSNERYAYHLDGLGSIRILSDAFGSLSDEIFYSASGEILAGNNLASNNFLYSGEQFDVQLDAINLRARFYRPSKGRFDSRDPFVGFQNLPISLNKYVYANLDPANGIDPSGLFTVLDSNASLSVVQSSVSVGYRAGRITLTSMEATSATAGTLTATQKGILVVAALGGAGAALIDILVSKESGDDSDDRWESLFHGTDIDSALALMNGMPLSYDPVRTNWRASEEGFYLTEDEGVAAHFAVTSEFGGDRPGAVVQYDFNEIAYTTIVGVSKVRPLKGGRRFNPNADEIIVPPTAFPLFNGLMQQGQIIPGPVR